MFADKLLKYAGVGNLVNAGAKNPNGAGIKLTSNSLEGAGNKSSTLAGSQSKPSVGSYKPIDTSKNSQQQNGKPMKFDMNNFTSGPRS